VSLFSFLQIINRELPGILQAPLSWPFILV